MHFLFACISTLLLLLTCRLCSPASVKTLYGSDAFTLEIDPHSPLTASMEDIAKVNLESINPSSPANYHGPSTFMGKDIGQVKEYIYVDDPKPPKAVLSDPETSLMFVSIASFRDKLCPQTLFRLFTKAKFPNRLRVGLVQQNDDDDGDCIENFCKMMTNSTGDCKYIDQIRIKRFHARDAKGPVWARAKSAELLHDEEYCMQIDSHMDFVYNWDKKMIKMWGLIDNEYAVLSTYVAQNTPKIKGINSVVEDDDSELVRDGKSLNEVPHLCMVTLYDMPRNWGTKCIKNFKHPKLTNGIWGAGLSFSKCHAERKSPYDPYISHIFDGEEFSKAAKLWTNGYDIYTPHKVFVSHEYTESQSDMKHSTWANHINRDELQYSSNRIKALLDLPGSGYSEAEKARLRRSKYGLGDRRSLTQFLLFSGVNTTYKSSFHSNRCGNIHYVPFIEHPLGPTYETKFDLHGNSDLGEGSRNLGIFPIKDTIDEGSIYYKHSKKSSSLGTNSDGSLSWTIHDNSNNRASGTKLNTRKGRAPRPRVMVHYTDPQHIRSERIGQGFIILLLVSVAVYTVLTLPQRAVPTYLTYHLASMYRTASYHIWSTFSLVCKYLELLISKLGRGSGKSETPSYGGSHSPSGIGSNGNSVKDV